jgi:hypothetical protein
MRIAAALPSLETGSPHRRSIDAMLEGLLEAGVEIEGFTEHDRLDQGDGFPVYHYLRMPERQRAAGFDLALYPLGRDAGPYQGVFALMNLYPSVVWIQDPSVHHLALGGIALLDNWTDYRTMLDAAHGRRGAAIAQTVASHWGTGALFRRYDLVDAVAASQPGVLVAWPSLAERVTSRLGRPVGLAPLGLIDPPTVSSRPRGKPAAGLLPPVAVMTVNESHARTAIEAAGAVLRVSRETTVPLCLSEPIYRAAGLPVAQHLGIDDRVRWELTTSPRRLSEVASAHGILVWLAEELQGGHRLLLLEGLATGRLTVVPRCPLYDDLPDGVVAKLDLGRCLAPTFEELLRAFISTKPPISSAVSSSD